MRALKAERCAEIFTDTASGKSRIDREAEGVTMADRTPLPTQLETIERLLERAKAKHDWPTIAPARL